MDRTYEFNKLVQSTEIRQNSHKQRPFCVEISNKECEIRETLTEIDQLTPYESYRMNTLLERASSLIEEYKRYKMDETGTEDQKEAYGNINDMIKTNALKFTIKMKNLLRKETKSKREKKKPGEMSHVSENSLSRSRDNSGNQVLQEEVQQNVQNEKIEQRRRIVSRIDEMGQIVEDIHMHTTLQEMELKRIDDIMGKTEYFGKKTINDLKETWEMLSAKRKRMVKYFLVWIVVILLFYVIRR